MEKCLLEWNIPQQKVLQFISDNGSNILKTTTNLKMKYEVSIHSFNFVFILLVKVKL